MISERFITFWSFADPNVRWVACGAMLLGLTCAVVGCFTFLQKRSLAGDALAHASLPGVTTAFILTGSRSPLVILGGALVSCLVAYFVIGALTRTTKIKEDSALAIVLSLFFALGIFQLTAIQSTGRAGQAGLDKLLFGQAASLTSQDLQILALLALVVLGIIILLLPRLKLLTFDRAFAASIGIEPRTYELLFAVILVTTIALALQLVGVVLLAALLLTPPAAARYWSSSLATILPVAGIFGAAAGLFGANISYLAPQMPTGPWIVVAVSAIFLLSCLLAPHRGAIARMWREQAFTEKVLDENLLRTLFKLDEHHPQGRQSRPAAAVLEFRQISLGSLRGAVGRLTRKGLLSEDSSGIMLTEAGLNEARRITRLHRLWEVYLSSRIDLPPDHVHADAEEIEHILTPDLEARLTEELSSPMRDPHGSDIPKD